MEIISLVSDVTFGKPNRNGRVYDRDVFMEAVHRKLDTKSLLVSFSAEVPIRLDKVCGYVVSVEEIGDTAAVKWIAIDKHLTRLLEEAKGSFHISPLGLGEINDGKIENYSLVGFKIVMDD